MKAELKAKLSTFAGLAILIDGRLIALRDCGAWPGSQFKGWRRCPGTVPGTQGWALVERASELGFGSEVRALELFGMGRALERNPVELHIKPQPLLAKLEALVVTGVKP